MNTNIMKTQFFYKIKVCPQWSLKVTEDHLKILKLSFFIYCPILLYLFKNVNIMEKKLSMTLKVMQGHKRTLLCQNHSSTFIYGPILMKICMNEDPIFKFFYISQKNSVFLSSHHYNLDLHSCGQLLSMFVVLSLTVYIYLSLPLSLSLSLLSLSLSLFLSLFIFFLSLSLFFSLYLSLSLSFSLFLSLSLSLFHSLFLSLSLSLFHSLSLSFSLTLLILHG